MTTKQKQGFTIIEVVLVLAIAGLIFLIVFLALPALQRSQRDTQRKNDLGRMISAIQSFQGNNRGSLPTQLGGTVNTPLIGSTYLTNFADPSSTDYSMASAQLTGAPESATPTSVTNITDGKLGWRNGVDCAGTPRGARTVSIVVALENGGVYCQNN